MTRALLCVITAAWLALAMPVAAASFGSIVGQVFVDLDGDLARSENELGLAGAIVQLRGRGELRDAVSDDAGQYRFSDVPEGTYELSVVVPEGYAAATPVQRLQQVHRAAIEVGPEFALVEVAIVPSDTTVADASGPTSANGSSSDPPVGTVASDPAPSESLGEEGQPAGAEHEETGIRDPSVDGALVASDPDSGPQSATTNGPSENAGPATTTDAQHPVPPADEPGLETALGDDVVATSPGYTPDSGAVAIEIPSNAPALSAPLIELGPAPGSAPSAAMPSEYRPLQFDPSQFRANGQSVRLVQTYHDDQTLWLGVPFRSQLDESTYAAVNCGPASLSMVMGAFGLNVAPADVRAYVNYLSKNYNTGSGTSLDTLAAVSQVAGLRPMDLYDQGQYRTWTLEMVRDSLLQGRPVITLVKYRSLPDHANSPAEFDHYIVIAGFYRGDFIYNDAAHGGDHGYRLLISPQNLERAWDASSMPRHAMSIGSERDELQFTLPAGALPALQPLAGGATAELTESVLATPPSDVPASAPAAESVIWPSRAPDVVVSVGPRVHNVAPGVVASDLRPSNDAARPRSAGSVLVKALAKQSSERIVSTSNVPSARLASGASISRASPAATMSVDMPPLRAGWIEGIPAVAVVLLVAAWIAFAMGVWNETRIRIGPAGDGYSWR